MRKMPRSSKSGDVGKYNLRCNRSVSEKMTKKDFIYDIRVPTQHPKKMEEQAPSPAFPAFNKNQSNELNMLLRGELTWDNIGGDGDARNFVARRCLEYECNYCREPIATFFSLSTHVKSHCRRYCGTCYQILDEHETMRQHVQSSHER